MRWFLVLVLFTACGGGDDDSAADDDSATPAPAPEDGFLTQLSEVSDYAVLSDGGAVKYLAPTLSWGREPPLTASCYFQDMHRYPWHLQFLRSWDAFANVDPATYEAWVVAPEARRYWGGAVQLWPGVVHPTSGRRGVLAFVVYSDPHDPQLTPDQILEVWQTLEGAAPFAAGAVAWVPDGGAQVAFAEAEAAGLAALGVPVLDPSDLAAGMPSTTWSPGEGYGTLHVVPAGGVAQDYGPRDVLITSGADNDMSLVSGLVTALPQNLHSHINLRLQEKGIPSATVPDIYENVLVLALDGTLVHIEADAEGTVVIEPADLADAEAFWESRYPDLPPVESDLSVRAIAPLSSLRHSDAQAYGVKAANLGELTVALPAPHRPEGVAVPFAAYADHLQLHGIDERIEEVLADPRMQTNRAWKEAALDDLRDEIRDAPVDAEWVDELDTALRDAWGDAAETTFLRLRSSTNVEDLDDLTGAGLYDSKSGCLGDDLDDDDVGPSLCMEADRAAFIEAEITRWEAALAQDPEQTWITDVLADLEEDRWEERPLSLALRKVWRSLWNLRAYDERAWYGIDHTQARMAVAIHPSMWGEQAEAVAVTNLAGPLPLYRVVSQVGELGVVRPIDPSAVAEVLVFRRDGDTMVEPEILVPGSASEGPIWSASDLETLSGLLFAVQDAFELVYTEIEPLRLDVEVDRTRDGTIVLKQVRPYVTFDPDGG
jgi:hypothetical protein